MAAALLAAVAHFRFFLLVDANYKRRANKGITAVNTLSLTPVPKQVGPPCAPCVDRYELAHRLNRCGVQVARIAAAAHVIPPGPDRQSSVATVERLQRDLHRATTALDAGDYDFAARVGFQLRLTLATLGVN